MYCATNKFAHNKCAEFSYTRSGAVRVFSNIKGLGVPFDIASYALLAMMVAQVCDLALVDFVHAFGDIHLYLNNLEQTQDNSAANRFIACFENQF